MKRWLDSGYYADRRRSLDDGLEACVRATCKDYSQMAQCAGACGKLLLQKRATAVAVTSPQLPPLQRDAPAEFTQLHYNDDDDNNDAKPKAGNRGDEDAQFDDYSDTTSQRQQQLNDAGLSANLIADAKSIIDVLRQQLRLTALQQFGAADDLEGDTDDDATRPRDETPRWLDPTIYQAKSSGKAKASGDKRALASAAASHYSDDCAFPWRRCLRDDALMPTPSRQAPPRLSNQTSRDVAAARMFKADASHDVISGEYDMADHSCVLNCLLEPGRQVASCLNRCFTN